jgi:hypothetical protein
MPLSTINNGASSATARAAINAAINEINNRTPLVRGSGVLQGYTVPATSATSPPALQYSFSYGAPVNGYIAFILDGTTVTIYVEDSDPSAAYWVDTSAASTAAEIATLFSNYINANFSVTAAVDVDVVTITNANTGSGAILTHSANTTNTMTYFGGGGTGTNAVSGSGSVEEVTLIAQSGTKTIKPVKIIALGGGVNVAVEIALKVGSTYYPVVTNLASGYGIGEPLPTHAEWVSGRASAALVARMVGTVPNGGSQRILAIVEQI